MKAAAEELGLRGAHARTGPRGHRRGRGQWRRRRRRRRVRTTPSGVALHRGSARFRERALLAAAALARRGTRRARDPRRGCRDGRLHHGDREGPRHRRGVRARRDADRRRGDRRGVARATRRDRHRPSRRHAPEPRDDHTRTTGGGAHVGRQADGRGVRARLLPPTRGARARRPGRATRGRARGPRSTDADSRSGARAWPTTARSSCSRCSPKARRACRATRGCAVGRVRPSGSARDLLSVARARRARPHRRRRVRTGAPPVDAARFELARSRSCASRPTSSTAR